MVPLGSASLLTDQWMGGAMSAPALTDYSVTYGSPSMYLTTMTLEGWIKASSWPQEVANLVRKPAAAQVFAYRGNLLCAYFWSASYYYRRWWVLPSSLVGAWHHWAVCWDGNGRSQRAWVDGVELTNQGYNNTATSTGSDAYPVYVGECPGVHDDVRLSTVVRYSANFTPHRYEASNVYTAAGVVDAGATARWDSLAITCAARTSNEVYAVYLQPSASATPDTGGAWTQAATGQTGSATLDLSGLGLASARYLHTRIAYTPSTDALQTYNIAVDSMVWGYTRQSTPLAILQSGQMRSY
jgi:hypothetical protein